VRFGVLRAGGRHPGGAGRRPLPLRAWPADAALWLDENGARRPRAARHILAALAARGARGAFAARAAGGGQVVAGPVSVLTLPDARAETDFVFHLTPYGHGEEPF
jgi:hypothetical protein